jgi:hypothetical protein
MSKECLLKIISTFWVADTVLFFVLVCSILELKPKWGKWSSLGKILCAPCSKDKDLISIIIKKNKKIDIYHLNLETLKCIVTYQLQTYGTWNQSKHQIYISKKSKKKLITQAQVKMRASLTKIFVFHQIP